ncbi:MAG TPA: VCBS repeat-containing protein [Gemmatimonadaceae bacterium]|nr:VCBS repeat-containing protein [Gemmatimonadaceae bacterium]
MRARATLCFAMLCLLGACSGPDGGTEMAAAETADPDGLLFTLLPPTVTGVRFENRLTETAELNVFTYRNFYNGGGVALGDLTGDGLPEIVLTANQTGPSLYLNAGKFRFRDVTKASGVRAGAESWTTGVTLADVNGDGRLDIYLCRAGPAEPPRRANALWINQGVNDDGVPTFREMAADYGVADQGYSTHAAFLDYDRDGDLDLFVLNNAPTPASSFGTRNLRHVRDPHGGARLYRNDGRRFTDVSVAAGIHSPEIAFGLGLAVGDVNRDGWPDIYVGNDFFERDYLYINNKNGTFSEALDRQASVLTYFSMGLDVADVDNDQWPDIYTTDMLPEDEYRLKTTAAFEAWEVYQTKVQNGYHHQLMRNMLQRNNGDGTFTDVGQMAGVARTDWSWSALIADLDLDGRKDIFVTNGLAKDITSQDYIAFLAKGETMRDMTRGGRSRADFERLTKAMSTTPLPNYAFHNQGGMRFTNQAGNWGLATPSVSSGAAYGDLDGDGALDLVVNNVNQAAFIYRNNARALHKEHRALRVRLEGAGSNRFGVGARVTVFAGADAYMQELSPARGFQSSVDYTLVFGLGTHAAADSVRVDWPDGRVGLVSNVAADELVIVRQTDALAVPPSAARAPVTSLLTADTTTIDVRHRENAFVDFAREPLVPKLLSMEGPYMAVADVNGDGLDDVFIGGAKEQAGSLLLQLRDGRFAASSQAVFEKDRISEDLGAAFFDANGDGHADLYVVSGGSEFSDGASALQDRLYLNDGRGSFGKAEGHLPPETVSGSRVAPADFDGDGDIDLFIGGRVVPWRYGLDPVSTLLRNDGRGRFTDVTKELAPELINVGMVTDAVWQDLDGDRRPDLIVVGEWMPIAGFRNAGGGKLQRMELKGLEKSHGWWNRIIPGDFTGDGRVDFIVGNLGLNSRLRASASEPATMHVKDFDGNGFVEQIVSVYNQGVSYPLPLRDDLIRALPYLAERYPDYSGFARQTITDIFPPEFLEGAVVKTAYTFATSLLRNDGNGSFTLVPLPDEAQLAPVYGLLTADFDGDGTADVMLAGNFDGVKPEIGRMGSSRGLILRGDGKGDFTPLHSSASGVAISGQARDIQRVMTARGDLYVVTRNSDRPVAFRRARQPGR